MKGTKKGITLPQEVRRRLKAEIARLGQAEKSVRDRLAERDLEIRRLSDDHAGQRQALRVEIARLTDQRDALQASLTAQAARIVDLEKRLARQASWYETVAAAMDRAHAATDSARAVLAAAADTDRGAAERENHEGRPGDGN